MLYDTVDPQNITGRKILTIFQKNILAAKQVKFIWYKNIHLLEKIVDYSKLFYQTSLEKIIKNDNPENFNEIKDKIAKFKAKDLEETEHEGEEEMLEEEYDESKR